MKWRLPILSLYIILLSLLGAGWADAHSTEFDFSPIAHFNNSHQQNSKLQGSLSYCSDNTEEDDHDPFVDPLFSSSLTSTFSAVYAHEKAAVIQTAGPVISKRFLRFRSILI